MVVVERRISSPGTGSIERRGGSGGALPRSCRTFRRARGS